MGEAAAGAPLDDVLARQGYEPERRDGGVVLRNCPFHGVARDYPPLVCGMNLALLRGIVEGLGGDPDAARMAPGGGRCCVAIDPF